jgi:hypothetical protein
VVAIEALPGAAPISEGLALGTGPDLPEVLGSALFGPPEGCNTYALLDAGRLPHLPELLAASGLPHRCLFTGAAQDTLGDAAPWLVALDRDSAVTRNLLAAGDAPWQMWDRRLGPLLRSDRPLPDLWTQLRKFTLLPSGDGGRAYFRFWEIGTMEAYVSRPDRFPALAALYSHVFAGSTILFNASRLGRVYSMTAAPSAGPARMPEGLRNDLRRARFYSNMLDQAEDFATSYPDETARYGPNAAFLHRPLHEAVEEIYAAGLTEPHLRARFLMLAVILYPAPWPAFLAEPAWQKVRADPARANDLFRDFCAMLKYSSAKGRIDLETWW